MGSIVNIIPGYEEHFTAFWRYITDKGIFVERQPDTVSADLFYHGVAVRPGMGIDGIGYITQMPHGFAAARPSSTHSSVTRIRRSAREEIFPILNIREASGKISVYNGGYIYVDDVAFL